jgi:hypothetical protein
MEELGLASGEEWKVWFGKGREEGFLKWKGI